MVCEFGDCPRCQAEVTVEPICPGYRDGGGWLQCYPPCGNAHLYECVKIACGWWFIQGMRKQHSLYQENETRRPQWLSG